MLQRLLLVFQTSCLTSIISQSVHNHSVSFAPDGHTEPVIVVSQMMSIELFLLSIADDTELILLCQISNVGCVVRTIAIVKGQNNAVWCVQRTLQNTFV
ncbi:MAG: hypothetical protein V3U88_08955 [Methylococcales bacterium]